MTDDVRQTTSAEDLGDWNITPTFLIGVYLAVNAIPDAALLVDMFHHLSERSRRLRFHTYTGNLPKERIWRDAIALSDLDSDRQLALVAVHEQETEQHIVGVAQRNEENPDESKLTVYVNGRQTANATFNGTIGKLNDALGIGDSATIPNDGCRNNVRAFGIVRRSAHPVAPQRRGSRRQTRDRRVPCVPPADCRRLPRRRTCHISANPSR